MSRSVLGHLCVSVTIAEGDMPFLPSCSRTTILPFLWNHQLPLSPKRAKSISGNAHYSLQDCKPSLECGMVNFVKAGLGEGQVSAFRLLPPPDLVLWFLSSLQWLRDKHLTLCSKWLWTFKYFALPLNKICQYNIQTMSVCVCVGTNNHTKQLNSLYWSGRHVCRNKEYFPSGYFVAHSFSPGSFFTHRSVGWKYGDENALYSCLSGEKAHWLWFGARKGLEKKKNSAAALHVHIKSAYSTEIWAYVWVKSANVKTVGCEPQVGCNPFFCWAAEHCLEPPTLPDCWAFILFIKHKSSVPGACFHWWACFCQQEHVTQYKLGKDIQAEHQGSAWQSLTHFRPNF